MTHNGVQKSSLFQTQFTGCKLQKAYTRLGSSCHNAYTRFQLLFALAYMHFCSHVVYALSVMALNAYTMNQLIEMHMFNAHAHMTSIMKL